MEKSRYFIYVIVGYIFLLFPGISDGGSVGCSAQNHPCFNNIIQFSQAIENPPKDFQDCRNAGLEMLQNYTNCQKPYLEQLLKNRECQCSPNHVKAVYSPPFPDPRETISAMCMSIAYKRQKSLAPLQCNNVTLFCSECFGSQSPVCPYMINGKLSPRKIACVEDFYAGRLDFTDCEFLKAEMHKKGAGYEMLDKMSECPIMSYWRECFPGQETCRHKRERLECVKNLTMSDPACASDQYFIQSIHKMEETVTDETSWSHQETAKFNNQWRSSWFCAETNNWNPELDCYEIMLGTTPDNIKSNPVLSSDSLSFSSSFHTGILQTIVAIVITIIGRLCADLQNS